MSEPKNQPPNQEAPPDPKAPKLLDDLAAEHGQKITDAPSDGSPYKWKHRVAAQVHGWDAHNYHHANKPVMLTGDVYLAALKAADGKGSHPPHEPAVPDSEKERRKCAPQTHVHGLEIADKKEKAAQ